MESKPITGPVGGGRGLSGVDVHHASCDGSGWGTKACFCFISFNQALCFIDQHGHWVGDAPGSCLAGVGWLLNIGYWWQEQSSGCQVKSWELESGHLFHLARELLPFCTRVTEVDCKLIA